MKNEERVMNEKERNELFYVFCSSFILNKQKDESGRKNERIKVKDTKRELICNR